MRRWAIVSSKYKWISMRCRAGRGRARLFFTLGAVSDRESATRCSMPPQPDQLSCLSVSAILPGCLAWNFDVKKMVSGFWTGGNSSMIARALARGCVRGRVNFGKGSAGTGELGSCGHHATISALAFEKELLFVDFSRTRPAFFQEQRAKGRRLSSCMMLVCAAIAGIWIKQEAPCGKAWKIRIAQQAGASWRKIWLTKSRP